MARGSRKHGHEENEGDSQVPRRRRRGPCFPRPRKKKRQLTHDVIGPRALARPRPRGRGCTTSAECPTTAMHACLRRRDLGQGILPRSGFETSRRIWGAFDEHCAAYAFSYAATSSSSRLRVRGTRIEVGLCLTPAPFFFWKFMPSPFRKELYLSSTIGCAVPMTYVHQTLHFFHFPLHLFRRIQI